MTWLHFVGKSYYSMKEFISEAKKLGVSRRISRIAARGMNFGDRVLLATWNPRTKHTQVFGMFTVKRLAGLSPDALDAIKKRCKASKVSDGGQRVVRRCGSYVEGATYAVECPLREIMDAIKDVKEPGKLLITGTYSEHARFRLRDIGHQLGFRQINYDKLMAELRQGMQRRPNPLLRGQFYVASKTQPTETTEEGLVGMTREYRRREEEPNKPKAETQHALPL